MKKFASTLLFGRDQITGLIALGIIGLFVLGCTCGKNLDLGNIGKNDNTSRASNTSSDNPFGKSTDTDSDATDADMPSKSTVTSMVRDTTTSFATAVASEDFTDLYNDSADEFKESNSPAKMKEVFKAFIDQKVQLVPAIAKAITADPEFSPAPYIRTESGHKILVTTGSFSSSGAKVDFDYEYLNENGEWKLWKIEIKASQARR